MGPTSTSTKGQASYDSELMLQPLPEKALTDAKDIQVIYDSELQPILFGLTANGRFVIVTQGKDGNNILLDLHQKFALPSNEQVTAFAVSHNKDPNTPKLNLVFATQVSESQPGNVYVVGTLSTEHGTWYDSITPNLLLTGNQSNQLRIHDLLLVGRPTNWEVSPSVQLTPARRAKTTDPDSPC